MQTLKKNFSSALLIFFILLITAISFIPSLGNGLTNWDDNVYLVKNPLVRDISLRGVVNIFTNLKNDFYIPLVYLSFAVEYHFFKLDPHIYHLTNLIFHLINCALVFYLIYLITKDNITSFLVSLLFGIHPMHVESVAWVSERKDMLYSFFFLWSLIVYIFYLQNKKYVNYFAVFVLFLFSLLSKPLAVMLPAVLILLDYLQGRSFRNRRIFLEKVPFLVLSGLISILTLMTQRGVGAINVKKIPDFYGNLLSLSDALIFYFVKMAIPLNLSCIYPFPVKQGYIFSNVFSPFLVLAAVFVFFLFGTRSKKVIFGILFFLVMMLPVLQLVPVGSAIAADRYTYISSIGIFYMVGCFISYHLKHSGKFFIKGGILFSTILILTGFSYLTWDRCSIWKDDLTLWNNVLAQYPRVPVALSNRANVYSMKGEVDKAIEEYNKAIKILPTYDQAYLNRGNAYALKGNYAQAIKDHRTALLLNPASELAKRNLMQSEKIYKKSMGKETDEFLNTFSGTIEWRSEKDLNHEIEEYPTDAKRYYNRATWYADRRIWEKAILDFNKAIELDPKLAEAYNNRGTLYQEMGLNDKALEDFSKALLLNTALYQAYFNQGLIYEKKKQIDKAVRAYEMFIISAPEEYSQIADISKKKIKELLELKNG